MGGAGGSMRNQRSLEPATLAGGLALGGCLTPQTLPGQIVALSEGGGRFAMRRALGSGTKPECALESMVSPITLPSRIGPHLMVLPCAQRADRRGSHTSQNARCMRHPVGEDVRLSRLSGTKPECALQSTI